MFDFDPIIGADIINALGVDPTHLQNAAIYQRVKGVIEYFKNSKTPRQEVLKLFKNKAGKPLDVAWNFVELQREKARLLSKLDPKDFEVDVAQEIVNGYLTLEKRERIKKDIGEHLVKDIVGDSKLDVYAGALREMDKIDKELNKF